MQERLYMALLSRMTTAAPFSAFASSLSDTVNDAIASVDKLAHAFKTERQGDLHALYKSVKSQAEALDGELATFEQSAALYTDSVSDGITDVLTSDDDDVNADDFVLIDESEQNFATQLRQIEISASCEALAKACGDSASATEELDVTGVAQSTVTAAVDTLAFVSRRATAAARVAESLAGLFEDAITTPIEEALSEDA